MEAVQVHDVYKFYKKYADRHKFLTIKSALVNKTLFGDLQVGERFEALRGVSFDVKSGQTLGIIGENGSGKSTLLKILAGISKPTAGEVITSGRISALIELGAGFHPEISGRENIFINGVILGLTRKQIQEKYQEIVSFAELEEFIDNPVKSYSSGMFMRLGFSIAINVNPDILLVDEVLAVGDASFVPKCLDKINEFRRHGKTIIYVSHDLATIERICDDVIWMKKGKIEMRGYPKRVVDAYLEYIGKKDEKKSLAQHGEEEKLSGNEKEKRWGSREIEISNVKMFDAANREKYIFEADEPLAIQFDVEARAAESDFVFGIGVYNGEGVNCYGSNTLLENYAARQIQGKGKVRLTVPALGLVNGTYFLDIAVHKRDGYPFDYHHFQYTFRVTSSHRDVGIARIPHRWEFSDNIALFKNEDS
ncbi:MAG: ABC transporter ATP-binding protein [Candidatus Aminicenantes bacterium]|nr:ABC transporter ATP-binding protein [Acidobacteriota bacterium]MCG2810478.1 ABC transporter ATP-binding protein [Candidatus Aminicenantes bacterium]